jgi:hypothetical protein
VAKKTELVSLFEWHLKLINIPDPQREYMFHEFRRWRFDYAWPQFMVAVELEGGIYRHGKPVFNVNPKTGNVYKSTIKSGHLTIEGYESDIVKYNTAVLDGWQLLRFTHRFVADGTAITTLEKLINSQKSI